MLKKLTILWIVVSMFTVLTACAANNNINEKDPSKVQVAVTFNALRELTEAVGKDKVQVKTIIPDGTEPHDFEPKVRDMETLSTAQIFVYNGLGMETWVDKALEVIDSKDLNVVDSSKGFGLIKNTEKDEIKEHGQYDPHIWLSLKGAEIQARNIKDALVKADPANKDFYEKNYNDFYMSLENLYNDYTGKFRTTSSKNFVTGHAAFAYLCRDFGLKQNSVEAVFAEGEPSARKLKELVEYCRKNSIKTIFTEDMASPKVSATLANEVGAVTKKIYTLESKEDNKSYLETMSDNLEEIYNSLK